MSGTYPQIGFNSHNLNYMQAIWTQINWENKTKIDLSRPQEVTFWAKKWEISSSQLYRAFLCTGTNNRKKIEQYLREKGLIE